MNDLLSSLKQMALPLTGRVPRSGTESTLSRRLVLRRWVLAAIASLFPLSGHPQSTLTITNGVQKFGGLTNTTAELSGRCELWVTNSVLPLSGCTVSLNSADAWLVLPAIKPSAVAASTYLQQVRINGAAAQADTNVRVVQYGQNGTILIPHSSTFQPLTVYSQPQFGGTARSYNQWTYYTGTGHTNLSSFKLKRGYQAVLAQSSNGASYSKCYIAQDGDLEVGVLPTTLEKQVQFIYVTPWRWLPKKGIAGDPGISLLKVNWWYNWNLNASSSRDLEYVAIRQNRWWPSLGQDWKGLGINTVLGYNEPDSTSQANIAVGDAIWSWPDLLGTGLRVGSPATTDGGWSSWLYPFITQADAAGLRVDFVGVHYYRCYDPANPSGAASQMYNALKGIYDQTKRPLWITEWNNGANWTTCSDPTYAQHQACVSAMIDMLENAPFVERYAIYNWVEDVRAVTTNGVLTGAGVTYRDKISTLSHLQAMPDNGTRGIAQFLFASNACDTSGYYNNGMVVGAPAYAAGHNSGASAVVLDGANSYVQLPANIARGSAFSFAAWVYWNGGGNWQRIFDFGNDTSHYLFLTPSSGSNTLRFAINNGGGEQIVERAGALSSGTWQHVAVTLSGSTALLYVNGLQVASSSAFSIAPSAFSPIRNYLGKSQWPDPLFSGKLDGVEIADYALTSAQISALYNGTQSQSFTSGVWTNDASGLWGASSQWSGGLVAAGVGRMADFSTLNLTADRTVTLDGPRTIGGLRFGDSAGAQNWILAGGYPLTLDGGSPNAPTIGVSQNAVTVSAPLAGSGGLAKIGRGTLTLTGVNTLGGGLTVSAGSVSLAGGSTAFGSGVSTIGYLTGSGNLTVTGGTLALGGELRVGGSDRSGTQYNAAGTATFANATVSVGALTVARGNYLDNSVSGTVTLNPGCALVATNDVTLLFAGSGLGKLVINGGTFVVGPAATKWLTIGYWDAGAGELDITGGSLLLENGTSIKMCRGSNNTGSNVVNQMGGMVTFYSDAGMTVGGGGNLDLNYAGGTNSSSTYHLKGGTLTVPQILASSSSGSRVFNFNGGILKAAGNHTSFLASGVATAANVRNGGAIVDTSGFAVTIGQRLQHSSISGDSAVDGGLTKNGNGTLTLSGVNAYTGPTTLNGGALALSAGGSISSSASIRLSAGTSLIVTGASFTLGALQTLTGSGTVTGLATINGTLAPGSSVGTLTFSTPPILNGTTLMELNRTNSPNSDRLVIGSGMLNYGGVLTVVNVGPALQAGDGFQLFSASSKSGAFVTTNLPSLSPGLGWDFDPAGGVLSVVQKVATNPTNILYGISGNTLSLSWPQDHLGWRLQVQTNRLGIGLDTNWFDLPRSAATNSVSLPLDQACDSVFYRLLYP